VKSKLLINENLNSKGRKHDSSPNALRELKLVCLFFDIGKSATGDMKIQSFGMRPHVGRRYPL
jgi:hypothetical protein